MWTTQSQPHYQGALTLAQPQNYSQHQQMFTNPQQIVMRQHPLYDAMKIFPGEQNYHLVILNIFLI